MPENTAFPPSPAFPLPAQVITELIGSQMALEDILSRNSDEPGHDLDPHVALELVRCVAARLSRAMADLNRLTDGAADSCS